MPTIFLTMFLVLGVSATVLAIVVVGMRGRGRERAPRIADHLATAAKHLNGEGQPPQFSRLG
ncbi:hypothetical protein ACQBAR_10960 [Propionibacteriaceae bacterium Y1685]|uniref:hypothetical protein n=1 Tax=Microlunatus sp. Y1700 TaxID=3418487 RepID=UPI003D3ADA62